MIVTSAMKVKRWSRRSEFGGIQCLIKEWRVFGVKVWSREIDRETVPGWVEIQVATLGSTEWRSKFAAYM